MNIKLRNTKVHTWIDLKSCYWKLQDIFPKPIYDGIEVVKGSGLFGFVEQEVNGELEMVEQEIFEGDFVRALVGPNIGQIFEVTYKRSAFRLVGEHTEILAFYLIPPYTLEIIGNVFDNPELKNGK